MKKELKRAKIIILNRLIQVIFNNQIFKVQYSPVEIKIIPSQGQNHLTIRKAELNKIMIS